jgi:D-3-phosphoglycerate dehydrogenase
VSYSVLIPQDIAEEGKAWLKERGYEVRMGRGATVEEMALDVVECDAILARTAPLPARVLEAGRKLKVIARHGAGYDNIDVARATELGIWVTFAPESNANTVAEYTIGCIIALARNLARSDSELRRGNWNFRNQMMGSDLEGKVLGIVTHAVSWDELFVASDFVTLHIPGGQKTKGIIGRREFSMMKKSAFLINTARGDIVNESDLIEALREGAIAGAALDVHAQEPPDPDNPLLAMKQVLLTPHSAAHTRECLVRMALDAARGIDEVLTGKRPTWPVNDIITTWRLP